LYCSPTCRKAAELEIRRLEGEVRRSTHAAKAWAAMGKSRRKLKGPGAAYAERMAVEAASRAEAARSRLAAIKVSHPQKKAPNLYNPDAA